MPHKLPNWIVLPARTLYGLIMIVFGLNGFLNFIPVPELSSFLELLVDSGYIYFVKTIEILGGFCLLAPRTTNLGLLLVTPITVNICAYHWFFDQRNWQMALVLSVFNLAMLYNQAGDISRLIGASSTEDAG